VQPGGRPAQSINEHAPMAEEELGRKVVVKVASDLSSSSYRTEGEAREGLIGEGLRGRHPVKLVEGGLDMIGGEGAEESAAACSKQRWVR